MSESGDGEEGRRRKRGIGEMKEGAKGEERRKHR